MATETVINGRLYTPEDENGQRQVVMLETDLEHVRDLDTGKTLKDMMSEQSYSNASQTESGLMSAGDKTKLDTLYNEKTIISENDPEVPCMWYQVLEAYQEEQDQEEETES